MRNFFMKFNIIPLKGERDTYTKNSPSKFPMWKNTEFYTDPIPDNVNTMMMTGIHPIHTDLQILVLDFDGPSHGAVGWKGLSSILHQLKLVDLEPYMVRRTGNGGFHLIYICDTIEIFRNEHNRGLNNKATLMFNNNVGDIDIRANGGLVFWDCKFSDTDKYYTLSTKRELEMTSSERMREFVDSLREKESLRVKGSLVPISKECKVIEKDINITMDNCEEYNIPIKCYYRFNQLRQATKDIWLGKYIITKSYNEFRKWGIFWRDCLSRGFPEYVVINRLRTGVQAEYDETDTLEQLKCLKYKTVIPNNKYYFKVFPEYSKY